MVARRDAARGRLAPRVGATYDEDARRRGQDSSAHRAGQPPPSDYRFVDRLDYMLNGTGFIYDQVTHLWLVDVATGAATRLTDGPRVRRRPGVVARRHARIAFAANRRRDPDLVFRSGHPRRRRRDRAA